MNSQQIREIALAIREMEETADGLDHETAVVLLTALSDLKDGTEAAIGSVRQRLLRLLDTPAIIGGRRWSKEMDGKWRPNHKTVDDHVRRHATYDSTTGEQRSAGEAVDRAIELMRDLFVARSSMPKTGALEKMSLMKRDVADWEFTGYRLKVEDVQVSDPNEPEPF